MTRSIPIACTLEGGEAQRRLESWSEVLSQRTDLEMEPTSIEIRFEDAEPTRDRLQSLVEAERSCCSFVEWDLASTKGFLVLSVRGEPLGVAAMSESFGLAES
jgi:hypothetical protein